MDVTRIGTSIRTKDTSPLSHAQLRPRSYPNKLIKVQPLLVRVVKGDNQNSQFGYYPKRRRRGIATSMHGTINAYPCQRHDIHDPL